MALTNANTQTTVELNVVPDGIQVMELLAKMQNKSTWETTSAASDNTASTTPTDTWSEPATPYESKIGSENSSQDWSDDDYLVDVKTELSVKVQAYDNKAWSAGKDWADASDEPYAAEDESWSDDEGSWEEDPSWADDETYAEETSDEDSEVATDDESYDESEQADYAPDESTDVSITVKGSDKIDLSWLGEKFASGDVTADNDASIAAAYSDETDEEAYAADYTQTGQADAAYETDDQGLDAYAEGESADYTEVEIAGDIDLETYAAYA